MQTQLDVQLTVNKEAGDLTLTLVAICSVLGEYEAREMCRQIELDRAGSALAACGRHQYGAPLRPWRYE
eukprot:5884319-Pleurochrysis_carterae.AAC.1